MPRYAQRVGLEQRVDERRDRRALGQHDQAAEDRHHEENRHQPELLAHAQERPQLRTNAMTPSSELLASSSRPPARAVRVRSSSVARIRPEFQAQGIPRPPIPRDARRIFPTSRRATSAHELSLPKNLAPSPALGFRLASHRSASRPPAAEPANRVSAVAENTIRYTSRCGRRLV